jgi:hypothetical protein
VNERSGEGHILKTMIDSITWDIEVLVFINFPSFKKGNPPSSTPPFVVKNRTNPPTSTEKSTQSGNPSREIESSNTLLTVLLVIAGIIVVGAVGVIIVMYVRHKKYVEKVEEEKMKKNEEWIKDSGVEMIEKHYVWSPDVIGGPMGELSVNIEDEKEKEENCSSSAALLGNPETEPKDMATDEKSKKKEEIERKKEEEPAIVPVFSQ